MFIYVCLYKQTMFIYTKRRVGPVWGGDSRRRLPIVGCTLLGMLPHVTCPRPRDRTPGRSKTSPSLQKNSEFFVRLLVNSSAASSLCCRGKFQCARLFFYFLARLFLFAQVGSNLRFFLLLGFLGGLGWLGFAGIFFIARLFFYYLAWLFLHYFARLFLVAQVGSNLRFLRECFV